MTGLTDRVQYHSDINFDVEVGDVLLFDEVDEPIFGDPAVFLEFTKKVRCICFTATSHDCDMGGLEAAVLDHIGCKIF